MFVYKIKYEFKITGYPSKHCNIQSIYNIVQEICSLKCWKFKRDPYVAGKCSIIKLNI